VYHIQPDLRSAFSFSALTLDLVDGALLRG
jgi:hypothetical protein